MDYSKVVIPSNKPYKSRVTILSCDDSTTPNLPSVQALMDTKPTRPGKHYTIANMQLDVVNPFNTLPAVNGHESGAQLHSTDKPAKLSPITHVTKKERVELPYILTSKKPAKHALRPAGGHTAYFQDQSNNSGDYVRETSSKPAILAGNERGQTSPTLGHKVRVRGNADPVPYK